MSNKDSVLATLKWIERVKYATLEMRFGGVLILRRRQVDGVIKWEVSAESFRAKYFDTAEDALDYLWDLGDFDSERAYISYLKED